MRRIAAAVLAAVALAACAPLPPQQQTRVSPCDVSETSYECQVERYNHANSP